MGESSRSAASAVGDSAPGSLTASREAAAALESVIITDKLQQRPYRGPNYQTENAALVALMETLATSPEKVLHVLAEKALSLCRGHSAGISIEEGREPDAVFRWRSIAGAWVPYTGGTLPRWNSPCATVLELDRPLLMTNLERQYPIHPTLTPQVVEALLAPFHAGPLGQPVGTVWVVSHEAAHVFDREDLRLLQSLAAFAGAAYRTIIERPGPSAS